MRITKRQLRNIIKETGDVYNPDQERADASRGYRNTDSEEEHQIYDEEYGWVTPEELEELTGQMHEHTVRLTESKLRQIIRKAINEVGVPSSSYGGNYSASSHGGGYREYDRQRRSREYEMEEEYSQGEEEKEQLGRLHVSLRKMHQQNPDQDVMSVVRSMMDQWDRSFEDEIIDYWTMLQS